MTNFKTFCSLLLVAFLLAAAAPAEVLVVEEIMAKVNGDIITRSDYERLLSDLRGEVARQQATEEQKQQILKEREAGILRDLIDERLLVQRGQELSINVEAQVLRQRDNMMKQYNIATLEDFETWVAERAGMSFEDLMQQLRENTLAQAVIGQEVHARIVVPREDVQKYYDEHKDEFIRSEGVRLSEILVSTQGKTGEELAAARKEAETLLARVQKGEIFGEIARRHSDSQSAEAGGDIGIYRRGMLMKEIEEKVFGAQQGYITDLIEVANGLLILKVEERIREGLAELPEVEYEIRNQLMMPRVQPAIREYLTELRRDAYIELRPGLVDLAAAPGKDTSWSDPAKLAPLTTTKEEVLARGKKRRLLWIIPLPGGGGKDSPAAAPDAEGPPPVVEQGGEAGDKAAGDGDGRL